MAASFRIDTLKFVRKLTGAGMDPRQAEAIVEGLSEADTSELATKADIASTNAEIAALAAATKADIAALRAEFTASLKSEIADVRVEMREMKAEIFRAMLVQAGTIVGLTVALVKLLP